MSLFGKPTAASAFGAATSSLFNQPANNNTSSPFGQVGSQTQTQTQPQPQPSNVLFGSQLAQYAQQQPQQQQQQQQPQQQQPQSLASSFLNASQTQPQLAKSIWEPGRESLSHKPVTAQVEALLAKWNPSHPNTTFKYYFYNKVDQSRIPFYQPAPGEDPREWEEAVHNKPGPGYMPALATGFKGISERLKIQQNVLSNYNQALHAINSSLDAIMSQHDLQTSVRALNAKRKHTILRQRCLTLASKVQVLRNRGYTLDKEEDELKTKLETLDRQLSDPALSARTEELWSRLILLRGYADTLRTELDRRGAEASEGLSEEAETKAKKILEDYDKQLQTLKSQVEVIKKDYADWEDENNSSAKA